MVAPLVEEADPEAGREGTERPPGVAPRQHAHDARPGIGQGAVQRHRFLVLTQLLQPLDLPRDGGLGEGELLRRPGVAAMTPDAEKRRQMNRIHARHSNARIA